MIISDTDRENEDYYDQYPYDEYEDSEDDLYRPPPGPLSKMPPAKFFIPAIFCVFLFYIASVLYSNYPVGDMLWTSGEAVIKNHEYWRLLTSIFVHSDMLHLIPNAFIILLFGWLLRSYFGLFVFPVFSFIIGIVTTFFTISVYDPSVRLIGASGMDYGMVALWIVFYLRYETDHRFPVKILRAAGFILAMMLPSTISPQTSYLAHAIGFGAGLISGIILLPFVHAKEPK